MKFKTAIKEICPPILFRYLKSIKKPEYQWFGNYISWDAALKDCAGYSSKRILDFVKNAALLVKNGEAKYERDGVVFSEIQYSFPLLSFIMWIAAQNNGNLSVADFGGSFGTTYRQNQQFLNSLSRVSWNIIEQENFVSLGRKEFETNELKFYYSIEELLLKEKPQVLILSGVLQYLKHPYQFLHKIISYNFDFIIIDRANLLCDGNDHITIQINSPDYGGNYPCWFFNKTNFEGTFKKFYNTILKYEAIGGKPHVANSGFLLKRNDDDKISLNH